ncbi:MAG: hypothetical protein ABFD86_15615 [Bryobacteraceae bacterium]
MSTIPSLFPTRYILFALLALTGVAHGQQPRGLSLKSRIELSTVEGRIDHLSADVRTRRLFVAALENQTVEVLDVQSGKRLRTITKLAEPQGVYFDPYTSRLFVACAKDGAVRLFDAASYQLLETAKFSSDADNIRYDARGRRIVVGYGDGALALLDPNGKAIGEIALGGHPESFQIEKAGTRAYVNVPDRKQIEIADLTKNKVVSKWPVTSALKNYPMALDEPHHRLLIGCRAPARMLVLDTDTGKQTASVEIVGDTDDLFLDAARRRVYVIGGQGFVDVFEQENADGYKHIARCATAPGARTGLFVPEWGQLFVAVPHRERQKAAILVYEAH